MSYLCGLNKEGREQLFSLPAAERIIADVKRGVTVGLVFVRYVPDEAGELYSFVLNYPQFAFFLNPIVHHNAVFANCIQLSFHLVGETIHVSYKHFKCGHDFEAQDTTMTLELFKEFIPAVEPLVLLLTDNCRMRIK